MNDTVSTSTNANASLDANDSRVIISICTTCKTQDAVADLVGPNRDVSH